MNLVDALKNFDACLKLDSFFRIIPAQNKQRRRFFQFQCPLPIPNTLFIEPGSIIAARRPVVACDCVIGPELERNNLSVP
jgi:hypothetical protein